MKIPQPQSTMKGQVCLTIDPSFVTTTEKRDAFLDTLKNQQGVLSIDASLMSQGNLSVEVEKDVALGDLSKIEGVSQVRFLATKNLSPFKS